MIIRVKKERESGVKKQGDREGDCRLGRPEPSLKASRAM